MHPFGMGRKNKSLLLATGQVTQYNSEPDDGYYHKDVVKSYTILTNGAQSGNATIQLIHLDANTDVSFVAATKEIDCTGAMGVFKAAGGETIIISGSALNNGTFTTKATGDANKILVNETIVNESAGASVVIKKQQIISNGNNIVIDNNTGKMWARYNCTTMGAAGNGAMPWTGVPYDMFACCAAVNAAALGGYSDWRIPNAFELMSITDFETPNANPNSTSFPSWANTLYWSSSTVPTNNSNGYAWDFYGAAGYGQAKTSTSNRVAFVRG